MPRAASISRLAGICLPDGDNVVASPTVVSGRSFGRSRPLHPLLLHSGQLSPVVVGLDLQAVLGLLASGEHWNGVDQRGEPAVNILHSSLKSNRVHGCTIASVMK